MSGAGGESRSLGRPITIAVLPVENLSGLPAPLKQLRSSLIRRLQAIKGISILKEETLDRFMERHRIRYTAGIDTYVSKAFQEETGAKAVLVTSLELYSGDNPPKIAFTSRLVGTGENPAILWMDGIGLTGDQSPGFLGLGIIEDPGALLEKAAGVIADSLFRRLSTEGEGVTLVREGSLEGLLRKLDTFKPKQAFRSPELDLGARTGKIRVIVLPFINRSARKYGGEMMTLQFIRELLKTERIDVVEPGLIRSEMLRLRLIMPEGPSLPQADLLFNILEADLLFSGSVAAYRESGGFFGSPRIDFSTRVLERNSRRIVWSSKSYNDGDEQVYFFDVGRLYTANTLASNMVRATVGRMAGKR
jgi:TolB-like protein